MSVSRNKVSSRILTRVLICSIGAVVFCAGSIYEWSFSESVSAQTVKKVIKPAAKPTPRKVKYSEFPHDTKAHKIDCGSCHKFPSDNWNKVRTGDAAFPDITEYPKHESCLKCHMQQFFKGATPQICSICHQAPSPRNSLRHPYPNPREVFDKSKKGATATSDFVVGFPHDKHIEIVSSNDQPRTPFVNAAFVKSPRKAAGEASCAVCHQTMSPQGTSDDEFLTKPPANNGDAYWIKKGTFKSTPIGHTTCFTCHNADSGMLPAPNNCAACHHLKPPQPPADLDPVAAAAMKIDSKPMMDLWRRRDSSGVFRHEFFAHVELDCATCHNVATMNTADPATKRVSISSCATCHATASSDDGGALNYEADMRKANPAFQCIKCHLVFGKQPIPESHIAALNAAAGK